MEPSYVWEVWHAMAFSHPHVKRYVLVKMNVKGGCTVRFAGRNVRIRPMTGKRFFTDEAKLRKHLREWTESELDRARRRVESLTTALDADFCGVPILEERNEPYPPIKNLKL